jgi:hypothetical protein
MPELERWSSGELTHRRLDRTQRRSRVGPAIAVTGAAILALSVFLPWYSVGITASGAAYAQQELNTAAQQLGNPTLQTAATNIGAQFPTLAGHQLGTVNAHQIMKTTSALLLILAAVAFLGALVQLLEADAPIQVSRGQLATVGSLATVLVLFKMIDHHGGWAAYVSLSLSWGIWLALLSSLAIAVGALIEAR